MPETIFGATPVEAILLIAGIIVIYQIVKRTVGQATDVAMEIMPWVAWSIIIAVVIAVIAFAGLWLYRQGQWSMQ